MHSLTPWFIVAKTPIREDNKIIPILTWCLAACITVVLAPTCVGQQLHVLVDQVGYEARAPKQALIMGTTQDDPQQFSLLDAASGKAVLSGSPVITGCRQKPQPAKSAPVRLRLPIMF